MDLPDAISLCLLKPGSEQTTPFGPDTLVFKVAGKMFAATAPGQFPARMNLKCDPERSLILRDQYESVLPGYHMNKKHWNTIILDGSLRDDLVEYLIEHSYQLVIASLPKAARAAIGS